MVGTENATTTKKGQRAVNPCAAFSLCASENTHRDYFTLRLERHDEKNAAEGDARRRGVCFHISLWSLDRRAPKKTAEMLEGSASVCCFAAFSFLRCSAIILSRSPAGIGYPLL